MKELKMFLKKRLLRNAKRIFSYFLATLYRYFFKYTYIFYKFITYEHMRLADFNPCFIVFFNLIVIDEGSL